MNLDRIVGQRTLGEDMKSVVLSQKFISLGTNWENLLVKWPLK